MNIHLLSRHRTARAVDAKGEGKERGEEQGGGARTLPLILTICKGMLLGGVCTVYVCVCVCVSVSECE